MVVDLGISSSLITEDWEARTINQELQQLNNNTQPSINTATRKVQEESSKLQDQFREENVLFVKQGEAEIHKNSKKTPPNHKTTLKKGVDTNFGSQRRQPTR